MFQIIKVIYAQRGKFTMSIKLQRAGGEQAANQHECLKHLRKTFAWIYKERWGYGGGGAERDGAARERERGEERGT